MAAPFVRRLGPQNSMAKDDKRKKRRTLDSSSSSSSRLLLQSGVQMQSHSRTFSPTGGTKGLETSAGPIPREVPQVFDEEGNDITPQPLYQADPAAPPSRITRLPLLDQYQSRSMFGGSRISSQSTIDSLNEDTNEMFLRRDLPIAFPEFKLRKYDVEEQVGEELLDEIVNILICESETFTLLDLPANLVSTDSNEAQAVIESNKSYAELCQNKLFSEKYVDRWMQTVNEMSKKKQVQTTSVDMADKAMIVTRWDIWDTLYAPTQEGVAGTAAAAKNADVEMVVDSNTVVEKSGMSLESTTSSGISPPSSLNEVEISVASINPDTDVQLNMFSEKFIQCIHVMEKAVLLKNFYNELASYRQLNVIQAADDVTKPETTEKRTSRSATLQCLWVFSCELVRGHSVTSMTWNKKNQNILAVGYGNFYSEHMSPGLVCCWSYKNIVWPSRIIHCDSAVTSLDFSANHPDQLAVGMCDGHVVLYNLQNQNDSCAISSQDCPKKHLGPVWQVKWTEKDLSLTVKDEVETLFSVGADGSIKNWFVQSSGLDCIEMLVLKKTHDIKKMPKMSKSESVSQVTTGMKVKNPCLCLDFYPTDSSIFVVGTPEGRINKCSIFSGRPESFKEHFRAVNCITFSPFRPDLFLSCSCDRTILLWTLGRHTPVLSCSSTQASVWDVKWSPLHPTVFGAVNDKQLEIWDLNFNLMDPLIVLPAAPGVTMTSLLFAPETDCVLVGDSEGNVTVYKLKNLKTGTDSQVDTLEQLVKNPLPI